MSALTTVPKRRRRSIIARVGWPRFLQEIGMLAPAVVLMTIFLITPFLLSFWTAMTNQPLVPRPTPVRFVGLNNFLRILNDDLFWTSLWNVTRFTLWVLPVQCGLAFVTALILNQKIPFRNVFRGMFFLPAITSMVVVCVIWGTLFQYPTGPLNHVVVSLSGGRIQPIDWLGDPNWAMFSIVLLSAWHWRQLWCCSCLPNTPNGFPLSPVSCPAPPVRRSPRFPSAAASTSTPWVSSCLQITPSSVSA